MLKSSKCFGNGLPPKPDSSMSGSSYKLQTPIPRATPGRHTQSPAPANRENNYPEMGSRRSRETVSPARASLQDIPINQYDSVMVNSRFEEIKRKYDSQLKPSTPMKEVVAGSRRAELEEKAKSPASEIKVQSFTRSTWESKEIVKTEGVLGSAAKQREMDMLAEQVKEIRRSIRVQEVQRTRSLSRNTSSFVTDAPNFGRSTHDRAFDDPRVQSIDKINLKIKQILNCLSENEKHISNGSSNINIQVTSSQYQPAEQMHKDKDSIKQRDIRETRVQTTESKVSSKPDMRISQSFISNGEAPARQSFIKSQTKDQPPRRFSLFTHKANERLQRAQSSIPMRNSILLSKRPDSSISRKEGDYILSSGKDLDEEIRKIQEKIRKSEEEKRRLDIKFESSRLSDFGVPERRIAPVTITPLENKPPVVADRALESIDIPRPAQVNQRSSAKKSNMDDSPSFKQLPLARDDIRAREGLRSATSKDNLATSSSTSAFMLPTASNTRLGSGTLTSSASSTSALREDRYYGYRKPAPQIPKAIKVPLKPQPSAVQEVETKKLVERLRQQVAYDEELRNSKLNFAALIDPQRWAKLGEQLQKKGITLTEAQLKVEFDLSLQEHNPFYSVRETQEPPESVAQKYFASQEYWSKSVVGNFDSKALSNEAFKEDRIDLERKGFLTVQDFVRFLNIETGTFYRNRDLILIFRRLSPEAKISFQDFIKIVCH